MSLKYRIVSDQKIAYVRGSGKVTVDDIMIKGAKMFAGNEWVMASQKVRSPALWVSDRPSAYHMYGRSPV